MCLCVEILGLFLVGDVRFGLGCVVGMVKDWSMDEGWMICG